MKIGIGAKLTTGMTLTPQMQQAIRLLQLSSLELEQEVQLKLDSNPLLEREEEWETSYEDPDNLPDGENYLKQDMDKDYNYDDDDYQVEGVELSEVDLDDYTRHETEMLEDYLASDDFYPASASQDYPQHIEPSAVHEYASHSPSNSYSDSYGDKHRDSYADSDYRYDEEFGLDGIDSSEHLSSEHLSSQQIDMPVDAQWDDIYSYESAAATGIDSEDSQDDYKLATQGNIQDYVRWQLNLRRLSTIDMLMAEYLIDSMDERGFITLSNDELFQSFDTMLSFYQVENVDLALEDIELVVKQIQNCEPLGVGARNLAECLLIQLNKLPSDTPSWQAAKQILMHSEFFANNNINALLKSSNLDVSEIQPALALLRTLNPNPALSYEKSQRQLDNAIESYDIPDVIVVQRGKHWEVSLNPETLPKLRINQVYAKLVNRNDNSEQGVYLKEQLYDARLFIRSIEERNQNLLKVATCIVKRQQAFFEQGVMAMQPMVLKDVADEVGLHESTVSRITTSKTIVTPKGLFSLKYFFSSQVSSDEGEGVSSTAISAMIKQMIEAEDPKKPLSDSSIMKHLQDKGIDIARRTVTKYREGMNIGSSTQRKVRF